VEGIPPRLPQPPNQRLCPPDARVGAPRSNETTGSRTLSDQGAESTGVICPPVGIDPGTANRQRPHAGDSTAGNPRRRSEHSASMIAAARKGGSVELFGPSLSLAPH
jgi:hypothetical protein